LSIAAKMIPNDIDVLGGTAALDRRQGRWRDALARFRRIEELDPGVVHTEVAAIAVQLRDWDTATAGYRRTLDVDRDDVGTKMELARVLMIGPGDFAGAKALLAQVPAPQRDNRGQPSGDDVILRWELFMLERDFAAAHQTLDEFVGEEFPAPFPGWKAFARGRTALAAGDAVTAHISFEKARSAYEAGINTRPDEPRFLAPLGLVDAYLGRKDDALRESQRALDLLPKSDTIDRPNCLANLALVYALTGETEKAITLVEELLTMPAADEITLTQLRSWRWDSLRNDPRFQKILAAPEPKTVY